MGFRAKLTTAVDPVARAAAGAAQETADEALTGIIPGSRLAADAIDGRTITGSFIRTAASGPRVEVAPIGAGIVRLNGNRTGNFAALYAAQGYSTVDPDALRAILDTNEAATTGNGAQLWLGVSDAAAAGTTEAVVGLVADAVKIIAARLAVSGAVTIGAAPTAPDHAVRRDYVTTRLAGGTASFSFPAAGTVYSQRVDFPVAMATVPAVVVSAVASDPQNVALSVGGLDNTGFTLYGRRASGTGTTGVRWIATAF